MADELVALKPPTLDKLIEDTSLRTAIDEAQQTTSHGALRRQKQYIARLMRELDHAAIRTALDALAGDPAKEKQKFRRAESLRDALLGSEREARQQVLESNGLSDHEALVAALAKYTEARNDRDRKASAKQVFRHLHAALD